VKCAVTDMQEEEEEDQECGVLGVTWGVTSNVSPGWCTTVEFRERVVAHILQMKMITDVISTFLGILYLSDNFRVSDFVCVCVCVLGVYNSSAHQNCFFFK